MDDPPSYTTAIVLSFLSDQGLIYVVSFIGIALLLLMSAVVAASEVAFFSFKPHDVDACKQSDDDRKQTIAYLLSKPRLLLTTILIMQTMVNVGIIILSTFMMWRLTETNNPEVLVVGLAILLITFIITFFGTIIPKAFATKNNLAVAKLVAKMWKVLLVLCKPIAALLLKVSNLIEQQFEKKGYQTTVTEELNQALALAVRDDASEDEKEILRGIVNFGTLTVQQVMKSRMDISAADVEMNFTQLMEFVRKSGFSRIPVFRNTIDKIEGVLYIKDLLPFLNQSENFQWRKLLRPGFFVPSTKKIDSLLKDFQEKRVHMALVVNESGGTCGLITLEDIIEEIIGDINDEFDEVGSTHQKN